VSGAGGTFPTSSLSLALTMGEPAGIGGELALKAWLARGDGALPAFFSLDDADRLRALGRSLGLDVPIQVIHAPEEAVKHFAQALPVLSVPLPEEVLPGHPSAANGKAVQSSIERAVRFALDGRVLGVVTNPIHKSVLYAAGFRHPGHTELLGELTGSDGVMMLTCPGLRAVPLTVHCALREVPGLLSTGLIVSRGELVAHALADDFGINRPRLAIAALNPHGGEDGALGKEEQEIIEPAAAKLRESGYDILGPLPADTLFHVGARALYDAVLCMYHDQALIPLKTIDFDRGVNVTLGLPIVRTSPDHGTAFDIAGQGVANPASLIEALKQAAQIACRRGAQSLPHSA